MNKQTFRHFDSSADMFKKPQLNNTNQLDQVLAHEVDNDVENFEDSHDQEGVFKEMAISITSP